MGTYFTGHDGRRPITWIYVEKTIFSPQTKTFSKESHIFKALLDTGATGTCISNTVVETLELEPRGKESYNSASGRSDAYIYDVLMAFPLDLVYESAMDSTQIHAIPNEILPIQIPVMAVPIETQGIDVLIGMDIISRGNLYLNKNFLSFEIPKPILHNIPLQRRVERPKTPDQANSPAPTSATSLE